MKTGEHSQTNLFNFTQRHEREAWTIINDGVMGGLSSGNFSIKPGLAVFQGEVSTANNGGFTMVRSQFEEKSIEGFSAFVLKVKGDGRTYQFRVKTDKNQMHAYIASFETDKSWQKISIAFSELLPRFRGRSLDLPHFDGPSIAEVAFLIGNKRAESFELIIEEISLI